MFSFYWGGGFPANASQMRGSDKLWHVPKQTHVPHCQPNLFPSQEINAACQMSPTCCQGSEWCFRGFWGGLGVSGWGGKLCRGMSWGCLHFCILIWGGGGGGNGWSLPEGQILQVGQTEADVVLFGASVAANILVLFVKWVIQQQKRGNFRFTWYFYVDDNLYSGLCRFFLVWNNVATVNWFGRQ